MPYEFIYADYKFTQITVTVDGVDSVCPTLDCGFTYVEDAEQSVIRDQRIEGTTLILEGTNLPIWNGSCDSGSDEGTSDGSSDSGSSGDSGSGRRRNLYIESLYTETDYVQGDEEEDEEDEEWEDDL